MKTANFPRVVVSGIRPLPFNVTEDDWLISITDTGWHSATIAYPFDEILFMEFLDTEEVEDGITGAEAEEIAEFIKRARELKKNVWVNCHAGISRSGAVVELLLRLGWEFEESIQSPARIPNALVYNSVRKFFPELSQSWDDLPTDIDIWPSVDKEW